MNAERKQRIRDAFQEGKLQVESVSPEGHVKQSAVTQVLRHQSDSKKCLRVATIGGASVVCTEDHSLFVKRDGKITPLQASSVKPGDKIVGVSFGLVGERVVESVEQVLYRLHTFDLEVPGDQNFVLSNGILAHNSYSIGGISLDIERSSKYESLKSNAEGNFDKATEAKARTVKIFKGLQQPRFGIGVRSSFGPHVGRGVLSPRSFVG